MAGTAAISDQPLWVYGIGAGWGLYEYPGWSVSDVNYADQLDHQSNAQTQMQTALITDENNVTNEQVYETTCRTKLLYFCFFLFIYLMFTPLHFERSLFLWRHNR